MLDNCRGQGGFGRNEQLEDVLVRIYHGAATGGDGTFFLTGGPTLSNSSKHWPWHLPAPATPRTRRPAGARSAFRHSAYQLLGECRPRPALGQRRRACTSSVNPPPAGVLRTAGVQLVFERMERVYSGDTSK